MRALRIRSPLWYRDLLTIWNEADKLSIYHVMGAPMPSTIEGRIASAFQGIPQVESIYIFHNDEASFSVVTILSDADRGAYDQVFEQERQLLDTLSTVNFDFHVLARRGRPLEEIVGSNTPVWQRNA